MKRWIHIEIVGLAAALLLIGISFLPGGGSDERERVALAGKALGVFLGDVVEGTILRQDVPLRNTLDKQIRVEGVVSSCGCTTARLPRTELQPGEEMPITVSIDTKDRRGPSRFRISVSIDGAPPATVVFGANVTPKQVAAAAGK